MSDKQLVVHSTMGYYLVIIPNQLLMCTENLDTPQRHCMQEVTFIGNILYDPISMIFSRRQSYSDEG